MCLSWRRAHKDGRTLHQPGSRERWMSLLSSLPLFPLVQDPRLCDGSAHVQCESSLLHRRARRVCFHGNSKVSGSRASISPPLFRPAGVPGEAVRDTEQSAEEVQAAREAGCSLAHASLPEGQWPFPSPLSAPKLGLADAHLSLSSVGF